MANDGPNTNGSNFFVSFAGAEHLHRSADHENASATAQYGSSENIILLHAPN